MVQDELVKEGLTTLPVASCNLHLGGGVVNEQNIISK